MDYIYDKRVIIVGLESGIGKAIAKEVAKYEPKELILVDDSENSLVKVAEELTPWLPYLSFKEVTGNITSTEDMRKILFQYKPEILFHTASWQYIETGERQPLETVKVNFLATKGLARLAEELEVDRFIFVSSIKAACPRFCIPSTLRMAEIYLQESSTKSKTKFISVRVGNVLGKDVFVVRTLQMRIANEGIIPIPSSDMEFYFLPLPLAADLILRAGGLGKGGEIYSLDKGRPFKIVDLARHLCNLAGLMEGLDIKFSFGGKWPPFTVENLSLEEDRLRPTGFRYIQIVETSNSFSEKLIQEIDEVEALAEKCDEKGLVAKLRGYFPAWKPQV
jgi:FlaA1/EpsC-like NDP-sugar epimerase